MKVREATETRNPCRTRLGIRDWEGTRLQDLSFFLSPLIILSVQERDIASLQT